MRRRSPHLLLGCSPMSQPFASLAETERPRATRVSWCIVALLMVFSFMSWFNRVCMTVAADDEIMPRYGISAEAMGTVYSAFFFAYALCMMPGGWLADRLGPRVTLTLMGFGSGVLVCYYCCFCHFTAFA